MAAPLVEITGYTKKGHGTTPAGVEVPASVKGDHLLLELLKRKKGKAQGRIQEVVHPSPDRVTPRCPYADLCGGCSWQQIAYTKQLEEKQALIESLFAPHPVDPIVGAKEAWHYRGKMEFTFSQDKEGKKFLGLMQKQAKGKVLSLSSCSIALPWMSRALNEVRAWWEKENVQAYHPYKDTGSLRNLILRGSADGEQKMVVLVVSGNADYALNGEQVASFKKALTLDEKTSLFLLLQTIKKGMTTQFFELHLAGPTYFEERLGGFTFRISPQAFFQPNARVADALFQRGIEMLELSGEEKVLDLYCGMATIGTLVAPHVRQVIGVEVNKSAVADAQETIERLGLENIHIYAEEAHHFLKNKLSFFTPDIVIVDPPREGLGAKVVALLEAIAPKKILYISCNPRTQREDLAHFRRYALSQVAPFDQFPHTPHIENIILLTANP